MRIREEKRGTKDGGLNMADNDRSSGRNGGVTVAIRDVTIAWERWRNGEAGR